jgi:hypothetical protein
VTLASLAADSEIVNVILASHSRTSPDVNLAIRENI